MTIKKILVPTDFSACANYAIDVALPLAKHIQAELFFLHLFPDPLESLHVPARPERNFRVVHPEISYVKSMLDGLVRRSRDEGVEAKAVLVYDKGGESIEEYAESYKVDLIVMGSHGAKGVIEWFRSSNAQHVSKNSDIPVLVLKQPLQKEHIKNILFASSFEENVIKPMLFITELAKIWDAKIHLLYVNLAIHSLEKEQAVAKMNDLAEKFPENQFTINLSDTNDEEFAISNLAHRIEADLISLTHHDRDGVIRIFSHTIAENLVKHEQLPVLVMPGE